MSHDAPRPTTARAPARPRPGRRSPRWPAAVLAALCGLVALGGCGVRLETPPPTEPVPDAAETLRASAVDDALAVQQAAASAAQGATDPALAATLTQIAGFAGQHVDALGGTYDSGLGDLVSPAPSESATAAVAVAATPEDVVVALVAAAEGATTALDETPDGGTARLLASVATSDTLSARRLAAQIGSAAADTLGAGPVAIDATPGGVGSDDLAAIIESEDGAGYTLEVEAALSEGDVRAALLTAAATHRLLAEQWAQTAGVAATAQDPRRVAYEVPTGLDAAGLVQQLDGGLAPSYASLVGVAAPGTRGPVAALLTQTSAEATAWGAPPTAFPGLPEQAG